VHLVECFHSAEWLFIYFSCEQLELYFKQRSYFVTENNATSYN